MEIILAFSKGAQSLKRWSQRCAVVLCTPQAFADLRILRFSYIVPRKVSHRSLWRNRERLVFVSKLKVRLQL